MRGLCLMYWVHPEPIPPSWYLEPPSGKVSCTRKHKLDKELQQIKQTEEQSIQSCMVILRRRTTTLFLGCLILFVTRNCGHLSLGQQGPVLHKRGLNISLFFILAWQSILVDLVISCPKYIHFHLPGQELPCYHVTMLPDLSLIHIWRCRRRG